MPDTTSDTASDTTVRPPLHRRRDDRIVAGVAAGLAAHLGLDPAIVRLGFVLLTVAGGAGLVLYAAGWLLIPEGDDATTGEALVRSRGPAFWFGIVLLVGGLLALVDRMSLGDTDVLLPLVLIAAGVALWRASDRDAAARNAAATATRPEEPAPVATDTVPIDREPTPPPPAPVAWTPPPEPPRSRSVLGRLTTGVLLLTLGVLALLDQLALLALTPALALASALAVVGTGLLVGTWVGRSRGLIVLGALLIPAVVATSLLHGLDVPVVGSVGDRRYVVTEPAALDDGYRLGVGELEVDLSSLELAGAERRLDASVGLGQLRVVVPADVTVDVSASVGAGTVDLLGLETADGTGLDRAAVEPGEADAGTLVLDLDVGAGEILVVRSEPEVLR